MLFKKAYVIFSLLIFLIFYFNLIYPAINPKKNINIPIKNNKKLNYLNLDTLNLKINIYTKNIDNNGLKQELSNIYKLKINEQLKLTYKNDMIIILKPIKVLDELSFLVKYYKKYENDNNISLIHETYLDLKNKQSKLVIGKDISSLILEIQKLDQEINL